MRFDSAEHLDAWKARRAFPAIHQQMQAAILNFAQRSRYLDLCCSYGLLAEYLRQAGFFVIGVDAAGEVLERAREAGIAVPLYKLRIERDTLDTLLDLIEENVITGIAARRALPELFDGDLPLGREFFRRARQAGVKEVFIEGRVQTRLAVSPLSTLDAEVALAVGFREVRRIYNVAHLLADDPS